MTNDKPENVSMEIVCTRCIVYEPSEGFFKFYPNGVTFKDCGNHDDDDDVFTATYKSGTLEITNDKPTEMTEEAKNIRDDLSRKEHIYEPKYGGKDHSGYDTMMLYEINYEREEMYIKGFDQGYQQASSEMSGLMDMDSYLYERDKLIEHHDQQAQSLQSKLQIAIEALENISSTKKADLLHAPGYWGQMVVGEASQALAKIKDEGKVG